MNPTVDNSSEILDSELLDYLNSLENNSAEVVRNTISELKGRIGIALHENNSKQFESMSDPNRYIPLLEILTLPTSSDSEDIKACKEMLNHPSLRIVDACTGEQEALKGLILKLRDLIAQNKTCFKKVILDVYDKNLDPTLLISRYELPSKNFVLDEARLRDAIEPYDLDIHEPTITIISYSDLYNTQLQYARMIENALKVSNIVVIIPGTFSLIEEEIKIRILYENANGEYRSFLI